MTCTVPTSGDSAGSLNASTQQRLSVFGNPNDVRTNAFGCHDVDAAEPATTRVTGSVWVVVR